MEMRIEKSPLDGAPHLDLSAQDEVSLGPALAQLEQALRWTIDDIDHIPRFKMLFNGKRPAMKIEPLGNGLADDRTYVVRYRDKSLNLRERQAFEELMEQDHGIKIVSTEKRGARHR